DWPGLTTRPEDLGVGHITARRPAVYLDADNPMWPAQATLGFTTPRLGISLNQLQKRVAAELAQLENKAQTAAKSQRWKIPSVERVKRLSPFHRAKSWEPLRKRNPSFAVGRNQR